MGRKSIGQYPADWDDIAEIVKKKADWKCVRCTHEHDIPNGFMLTVHHLDLNKSNCAWWNIPALCQRCHLSIQGKVIMERAWMFDHTAWFVPFVAGFYAARYARFNGLVVPTNYAKSIQYFTHDFLMANAKAFIEYGQGKPIPFDVFCDINSL